MLQLPPEWHPQWGIMMAWPHRDTDWADMLPRAEPTFRHICQEILAREHLLLLCRDASHEAHVRAQLREGDAALERLVTVRLDYNDTWTRDYGPITVLRDGHPVLLDFTFNGWGNKYDHGDDNTVTARLQWQAPVEEVPLVLEGGGLDTDGQGTLLVTERCLLNPNRNPEVDREELEARLKQLLGVQRIWWLRHGWLEGDDTDGHVDMLARFCSPERLAYMRCEDPDDIHYPELRAMEAELEALANAHDLDLIPLPLPPAVYSPQGHRLPGSYANFLILNEAVLLPVYDCDTDRIALERLETAFPEREIVPIQCRSLVEQHGSLHCVTMQLPLGVR